MTRQPRTIDEVVEDITKKMSFWDTVRCAVALWVGGDALQRVMQEATDWAIDELQ